MTTTAPPTTSRTTAIAELDLDARLALRDAQMTACLDEAHVAFEVNTAHIVEPLTLDTVITQPVTAPPVPAPCPYSTPVAACLHRAHTRLQTGWCTGRLRDEQGAVCPIGAIRTEARTRGEADDACALLLEAIRRDFPDAETVPSWNDRQHGPRLPLRMLDRAAQLADRRGI